MVLILQKALKLVSIADPHLMKQWFSKQSAPFRTEFHASDAIIHKVQKMAGKALMMVIMEKTNV